MGSRDRPAGVVMEPLAAARVSLAKAALELSDLMIHIVETAPDRETRPGEFVELAQRSVMSTKRLLVMAAIVERERGTSWVDLGQALGISKQAVHERYATAIADWRASQQDEMTHPHVTGKTSRVVMP